MACCRRLRRLGRFRCTVNAHQPKPGCTCIPSMTLIHWQSGGNMRDPQKKEHQITHKKEQRNPSGLWPAPARHAPRRACQPEAPTPSEADTQTQTRVRSKTPRLVHLQVAPLETNSELHMLACLFQENFRKKGPRNPLAESSLSLAQKVINDVASAKESVKIARLCTSGRRTSVCHRLRWIRNGIAGLPVYLGHTMPSGIMQLKANEYLISRVCHMV